MKHIPHSIWIALLLALIVCATFREAAAAEVRAGLSTRETYAGLPVTLQIQISNASDYDAPTISEIDGLEIKSLGTPGRSTQITSINGQTTTNTSVTYAYEVTPQRTGSFRIPPITVVVDGRAEQTPALQFVASKSETGDLLFVEIAGKEKEIYVGQALDLTLKIWLRPYRDAEREITLSEGDMWQMISDRSSWGAFDERMHQLADEGKRPAGKEVLRKDRDGLEHSYYLYEINATIYPQRPGRIEANDVNVVVGYPTAIGQSRDPFGGFFDDMPFPRGSMFGDGDFPSPFGARLVVQSVRPIVAEAKVEPIEVLPIPTASRPAGYRGAVGTYRIVTEASPTTVKAGDPINLLIGIAGTGPMELVQAPPLAELPELTADFKVPNEPLAGFVQDDRKVFSTSIRPRKAGIAQVPSIPFSFFDPQSAKFITVHSKPISIHVEPADMLALDAIVGRSMSGAASSPGQSATAADASPVLANYAGDDLLAHESLPILDARMLALLLAAPPLLVLVILVTRASGAMSQVAGQFGSGLRRFHARIEQARQPIDVADALQTYLAKRLGLNAATADAAATVGALRTSGYRNLAVRCERILSDCSRDSISSGFGGRPKLDDLQREAVQLVEQLQTEGRRLRAKPTATSRKPERSKFRAGRTRSTTASLVAAVALAGTLLIGGTASAAPALSAVESTTSASSLSLTVSQQKTLLAEANELYNHALSTASADSADAKQAFADAAEKYQLLVDAGVTNSRLYFNLGNAYLKSGQIGRAIANYQRCLRLDSTNAAARKNLAFAQALVGPSATATEANQAGPSPAEYVSLANSSLNRYASPRSMMVVAIVAWLVLWAAIGLRLFGMRFLWKSVATAAVIVAAFSAASYTLSSRELEQNLAVVVAPDATLRVGDGDTFAAVAGVVLEEGQRVELLKSRSGWLQVRTAAGQTGWLPSPAAETL